MADAAEVLQQIEDRLAVLTSIDERLKSIEQQLANPTGVLPNNELTILTSAREFNSGNTESLADWNKRKKALRKKN